MNRAGGEAGPELALLAHAYGWPPDVIESLTTPQLIYYLRWLPLIEARRGWGAASLEAALLNVVGGKPAPVEDGETASPPTPEHLRFTAEELLPWWAELDTGPGVWTPASAKEAIEHARDLPAGALALLDFRRLRAIASN